MLGLVNAARKRVKRERSKAEEGHGPGQAGVLSSAKCVAIALARFDLKD
jgi:hypothetical protein